MIDTEVCDDYGKPSLLISRAESLYRFKTVCKTQTLSTFVNNDVAKTQFLLSKMENSVGVCPGLDPVSFCEKVENIINSSGGGHPYLVQTV